MDHLVAIVAAVVIIVAAFVAINGQADRLELMFSQNVNCVVSSFQTDC